jgi:ABC-type Zn uptake system ZnuABC Zn-binding protein ZnuA
VLLAATVALAGCATLRPTIAPPPTPADGALEVMASTTVIADFVRQVGGSRVNVTTLMPAGSDPHTFVPSLELYIEFDLVVWNGLGLDDVAADYAPDPARGLAIAESLDEVEFLGDAAGNINPHVWVDPGIAAVYVDRIRLTLIGLDPPGQQVYDTNAEAYLARLEQLEVDMATALDEVPADNRGIFVTHDGLDYLGDVFGLEILGTIYEADDRDLTSTEAAELTAQIAESVAAAVIGESHLPQEPAQSIATNAGVPWVQFAFTDSLGTDPQPDTYEEAMRHNVELIAAALTL